MSPILGMIGPVAVATLFVAFAGYVIISCEREEAKERKEREAKKILDL